MKAFWRTTLPGKLLFALLIFCASPSIGQTKNIKFSHLGIEDGLSLSFVTCIFQDSQGFMWVGTNEGLNKYDGYKFTVYKTNEHDKYSISHNIINGIAEDSKGNIWIATSGGINMLEVETERFIRYTANENIPNSLSGDYVQGLIVDHQDNLWLAVAQGSASHVGGLNMFDPKTRKFTNYTYNAVENKEVLESDVYTVFQDSKHNIWVGTRNAGLKLFDPTAKMFTHFRHHASENSSIASDDIRVIFEDSRHNLWIGTRSSGLELMDVKRGTFTHFRHQAGNANSLLSDAILSIGEDNSGNLWVGTDNNGLSIMDARNGEIQNYTQNINNPQGLNNGSIYSICKDEKGNMWLGTFSGGINFFSAEGTKFAHYRYNENHNSINSNVVFCIREDSKGNLLLATDGGGLNIFDRKTGTFKYLRHEEGNSKSICGDHVLSTLEDSEHNIWVGTWGEGITVYNPGKNSYRHFKNNPEDSTSIGGNNAWSLVEDRDKNIWIGTYWGGLSRYNRKQNNFTQFKNTNDTTTINSNVINTVFEDSKGNIWIGTVNFGLDLFNKQTNTFTHFVHSNNKNSISDNIVTGIYEDKKGILWIGTSNGLNSFDVQTRRFIKYGIKEGLPHNYVRGITEDGHGNLWISTNWGLSKFNVAAKTFENYSVADGLQSLEFKTHAVCKSNFGMAMYFGGINGFNEFYPDSIKEIAYEPPIVFTDFQIFNKHVPIADSLEVSPLKKHISKAKEITISYRESVITFEFASLDYSSNKKKQYLCKLEGFDEDWRNIGTRNSITYTNLDQGEYTLKVKSLNNKDKLSKNTAELKISITPPIWKTWWFRLLSVILLASTISGVYSMRVSGIRKTNNKLQKLVDEKMQELTERKRVEKALSNANTNLELTIKAGNIGLWSWDIKSKKYYFSPEFKAHIGFTDEEFPNTFEAWKSRLHPNDAQVVSDTVNRALHTLEPTHKVEFRFRHKDGSYRWILGQGSLEFDENGNASKLLGTHVDITDRKRAEAAIEESEERLRQAVHVSQIGIFDHDQTTDTLYWSSEHRNIFGYDHDEPISVAKALDHIHPDDLEQISLAIQQVHDPAGDGLFNVIYRIYTKQREIRWVNARSRTIFEGTGVTRHAIRTIGALVDITEQKQFEETLQAAKELAEDANRAKTEFLANMSHEIRTPMNSILGFSEILLNTQTEKNSQGYLKSIISSGRTLLSLINDLLDLSKIEAGKLELQNEPVQLVGLLNDALEMFRPQLEKKSLLLDIKKSDDFPRTIKGDEVRLRQILINLVGNAVKFTESGEISAYLGARNFQKDVCDIEIVIRDTGIGIDAAEHESIFESFRQARDEAIKHFGGTGLGLAISSRLTKLMGGRIALKSKPGEGSTFTVHLPKIGYMNNPIVHEDELKWRVNTIDFQNSKVMIVDDVPLNVFLLEAFLEKHGLQFITASNGQEAVEKASQYIPDLILMDFQMPVMDGRRATEIIKSTQKTKKIPVVALTAAVHSVGNELDKALFNGFLFKPVSKDSLLDELKKFLPYRQTPGAQSESKKTSATISDDNYQKLKAQASFLSSHFLPRAARLNEIMDLKAMNAFIRDLKLFSDQHQIEFLAEFTQSFYDLLKIFDVDGLNDKLWEFTKMIKSLDAK